MPKLRLKPPAIRTMCQVGADMPVGIVIPVYDAWNNHNLDRAIYTIEECCDLPYQLKLGVGKNCVAKNRNKGLAKVDSRIEYIIMMDDDVLVGPGFASKFVSVLQQGTSHDRVPEAAGVGVVSAVMYGPGRKPQNDLHPDAVPPGKQIDCLPPGTCFAYNRARTPIVFDEDYQGSQWEDTDAMMQVKALGQSTVATGNIQIMHMNNWSENKWWNENRARFMAKWPEVKV